MRVYYYTEVIFHSPEKQNIKKKNVTFEQIYKTAQARLHIESINFLIGQQRWYLTEQYRVHVGYAF